MRPITVTAKNFGPHDDLTLEFSRGMMLVYGPNGVGKSTAVVETVAWGLWGETVRGVNPRPADLPAGKPTVVTVVCEHQGVTYTVTRKTTGKSPTLSWSRDGQAPVVYETTTKAQKALEAELGDLGLWVATSVFSMDDADMFTQAGDSDRKKLLERLLGLELFDEASAAARTEAVNTRKRLAGMQLRLQGITASVAQAEEGLARLQFLEGPANPPPSTQPLEAELIVLTQQQQQLTRSVHEAQFGLEQVRRQQVRLVDGKCITCGQPLPEGMVEHQQQATRDAEANILKVQQEIRPELDAISSSIKALTGRIQDLRSQAQQHQALARVSLQLTQAEEQLSELYVQKLELELGFQGLTEETAVAEHVARVLGPKGVRGHILGRALSALTELANTYLSWMTSKIRVSIDPVVGADGSVQFKLSVQGAGGGQYKGASGGERRRINVALLMALSQLRRSDMLIMDDLFDAVDSAGATAIVRLLAEVAKKSDVVVITHDQNQGLLTALSADARKVVRLP